MHHTFVANTEIMIDNKSLAAIRRVYQLQSLLEKEVLEDPLRQFEVWWQQTIESKIEEPNAFTLGTCNASGFPSSRIVLLKAVENKGFVFYTNYDSRKGREIEQNPLVSILFFWQEMERQIRIEGKAQKISATESDQYFLSRPRESRIGTWSSPQSRIISDREVLQKNVEKYNRQFADSEVPRPANWGGYIVHPHSMEFWQGRPGRLHDRLQYILDQDRNWKIQRLAP